MFVIGEGEEVILELIEAYKSWKNKQEDKEVFLKIAAGIKGIYVPSFYKVYYNSNRTVEEIKPIDKSVPKKLKKDITRFR